jgi:hypothetical protein
MFIEKLPVGWDRADGFWVYPQISPIKGDYAPSGKLGERIKKHGGGRK